jgi:mRNA-degrading endonuclease RelE of RelBE toxin-antitoxin system
MKKHRIFISPSANDRMYDHFLFLAEVSEDATRNLLAQFVNDIQSLEHMPQINTYLERPYLEQGKYRYKLSCRRYRIVYQIIRDCVFVENIQDCRQDNDKNLV